ncbi:MAG: STAS-like domain-containing protein [Candidatus Kerfeldbacteria bacterium]|nr:STAS-like domain-containing protein [Candidatus Kerfeldbacteria bacterium]
MTIQLVQKAGVFAESKEVARAIRIQQLIPTLEKNEDIILDFTGIEWTNQAFIHVLISDLIRNYGNDVLEKIQFKFCNETVKGIISIVTDYMQESE